MLEPKIYDKPKSGFGRECIPYFIILYSCIIYKKQNDISNHGDFK